MKTLFRGLVPVCRKEFLHIIRDPGTLFFALVIPMLQLFLFGFAVDTNIRQIPTVVLDESNTQDSRRLLQAFAGSDVFDLKLSVQSQDAMYESDPWRQSPRRHPHPVRLQRAGSQDGTTAAVLVLVDGSDSSVAGQAMSTATGVALKESLGRALPGRRNAHRGASIGALHNPATRSANFFVPGLIAILLPGHGDSDDRAQPGTRTRTRHPRTTHHDPGSPARLDGR